ncbi:MAG: translation elongation factor Ts [Proteobacteria bacterium]|jgi:elongation factor Ts|nr:translation elongation factor Ts [Pseudomonadota bacterium]
MSQITSGMIKELRDMTGAGMMDCKAALSEAEGSIDKAIEVLRKKGLKDIEKRSGKTAAEGSMGVYTHPGDQVVAIVELNCETDFVARGDEFRALARDLAMHVAAMKPTYLSVEDVPEEVLAKEREILLEQLNEEQKKKADRILPGKIEKFLEGAVLLRQIFIKDETDSKTIKDMVDAFGIRCGEKVSLRRFSRLEIGEGIEKVQSNIAADVAAMVGER